LSWNGGSGGRSPLGQSRVAYRRAAGAGFASSPVHELTVMERVVDTIVNRVKNDEVEQG
jgi:hypothetical protein